MKNNIKTQIEEYELMLNIIDTQSWILYDIETYGYANKSHANFLGKHVRELKNKNIEDILLNKKEVHQYIESNRKAWKDKKSVTTKEWFTNNEGQPRLLHVTKIPILDDKDNIKYIVCKAYDITDKEQRKNNFKISEQQYHSIVENHPDLICRFLPNCELTFVNKSYRHHFASADKKLVGTSFLSLVPKEQHKEIIKNLKSFNIENSIKTYEHSAINSKGKICWHRWTDEAFFNDDGEIVEFQSIGIDITELKETEKALQKKADENQQKLNEILEYDKLKTEFFANISHELRTPLNLILSTLQLIDYQEKNNMLEFKKKTKYNNIVKQNCYRLLRLINNLIDITKIDSGFFNLNLNNYNIVRIVEDITLSVAEYIKNKNITLLFDTDVEEKFIACDPDQIERIILNLLSNAIKFTKPGGNILVNISDKKENLIISIKDTGIGIPKDKRKIIFDRFSQIDKSFTRNHEGSGIGLSLTQSLIKMHEGNITVKSQYGKGSEFIIELPVKVIDNDLIEIIDNEKNNNYVESINIEFSDIYSLN